jgi:hypothetical protein
MGSLQWCMSSHVIGLGADSIEQARAINRVCQPHAFGISSEMPTLYFHAWSFKTPVIAPPTPNNVICSVCMLLRPDFCGACVAVAGRTAVSS